MKQEEKKQGPAMPDTFWDDWRMATAGIKGERTPTKRTLERWRKEVDKWNTEHEGDEHT